MSGGDMFWLPWVALAAVLALVGAWWAGRRGDPPAAVRRVGYAVGVLGLWALGVPALLYRLGEALSGWAARLLFNPLSWLGLAATALALVLFLVGTLWGRRRSSAKVTGRVVSQPSRSALAPTPTQVKRTQPPANSASDEDAEIEALLRRRGIS